MIAESLTDQKTRQVDICLAIDKMYALGAQLTCYSILQNLDRSISPVFHLILNGQDLQFERDFTSTLDQCNRSFLVKFYTIDDSQFSQFPEFYFPSKMLYARLLIPELLDIDRVIYIDSDILVLKDLAILAGDFRPGIWCKAVLDASTKTIRSELSGSQSFSEVNLDAPALNSGLMVLDIKALRDSGKFREALALLLRAGDALRNHDQSAINVILNGDFEQLCPSWNYMVNHYPKNFEALAVADEGVNFHFVTSQKPWLMARPVLPFILYYRYARNCGISEKAEIATYKVALAYLLFQSPTFASIYYSSKSVEAKLRGRRDRVQTFQGSLETLKQASKLRRIERIFMKRFR